MRCDFDQVLVCMYADGELTPNRAVEVEQHIHTCQECRRMATAIQDLRKAFGVLPREEAPVELIERILIELETQESEAVWKSVKATFGAVWKVAMHGFRVEDNWAEPMRKELPGWVSRWVLFV